MNKRTAMLRVIDGIICRVQPCTCVLFPEKHECIKPFGKPWRCRSTTGGREHSK